MSEPSGGLGISGTGYASGDDVGREVDHEVATGQPSPDVLGGIGSVSGSPSKSLPTRSSNAPSPLASVNV